MHTDGLIKSFTVLFDIDSCGRERGRVLVHTLPTLRRHGSRSANSGPPKLGRARTRGRAKTVRLDGEGSLIGSPSTCRFQKMWRNCTKCFFSW